MSSSTGASKLLSILVPCYNEAESLGPLCDALRDLATRIAGDNWEVVLVDDGSTDGTVAALREQSARDPRIRGVLLSRNFGQQAALATGMPYLSGDVTLVLDADLQDPVNVAADMVQWVLEDRYDLVIGVRESRDSSFALTCFYKLFYFLMNLSAESPWPRDAGDFSAFNRRVRDAIVALPENQRILRGLRAWVGFRQGRIAFHRPARATGVSKYTLRKLVRLARESITNFTIMPLRFATFVGFGMSFLTIVFGVLLLLNRLFPHVTLFGYSIGSNAGTATLALLMLFLFSALFLCVGIMGEYLALLVHEVKGRPSAVVREVVGWSEPPTSAASPIPRPSP